MDANFEQFRSYNEESFEEAQNVVYKCISANNTHIVFECRAPKGSVLLADTVLETMLNVTIRKPDLALDGERTYKANDAENATVSL